MPSPERLISLACLLFLTALAVGCGGGSGDSNSDAKYLVIFCQSNNAEPYRAAQNERFEELFAGRDDIEFIIFDGQGQAENQVSQIEQAISKQPDLLIIAPHNEQAPNAPMKAALDAGIHTICLERTITGRHYTTFVGCDNVAIGRQAGQFIADALEAKHGEVRGRLVEITGMVGSSGANDRHNGAFEVLQPYIDSGAIQLIDDPTGNWYKGEAMERMEEVYVASEGEFDVVYAHNDPMAYGAYLIVREKNPQLADDAIFVGVDGLPSEGALYVNNGELDATFEYPLCADKAFELTLQLLEDEAFEPEETYILESRAITDGE